MWVFLGAVVEPALGLPPLVWVSTVSTWLSATLANVSARDLARPLPSLSSVKAGPDASDATERTLELRVPSNPAVAPVEASCD